MFKSKDIFLQILLFLLICSINSKQPINLSIAPESDFILLKSRQINQFTLNKQKLECYFSFENAFEGSDLIINFKKGKGFITYGYLYDSYDQIKTDDKGQYVNYIKTFTINENNILIKNTDIPIKKVKYYLVLKNMINSDYKDYISFYNEKDPISLEPEQIITFEKFYSQNKYDLTFSHTKNEKVSLELYINKPEFIQQINILSESTNELIYQGEINSGEILLNDDTSSEGNYIIQIQSQEEPYTDIVSSIILHKGETLAKEIIPDTPLHLSYTSNKNYNFYVKIDDYEYEEEGIITFKFGKQIYAKNLLSHCHAKVLNLPSNADDKKIIPNMPANEEENEAYFTRLSEYSDIYQLFFKKTKNNEDNKSTYLLIHLSISLDEYHQNYFIEPEEFSIYLSKRAEKIILDNDIGKTNVNKKIALKNYFAEIYKIILPDYDPDMPTLSYIFYTSEYVLDIYNNSMLINTNVLNKKPKMIYAISPIINEYNNTKVIYLKLFGATNGEINFRVESTESIIYYVNKEERIIRSFSDKLTDCNMPFYYIGDYSISAEKGYIFQETLYGKINLYYKGKVDTEDESILIKDDPKYLSEKKIIGLKTTIDIIELKCENPGYYQVHLINESESTNLDIYSREFKYLPKNQNITIIPNLKKVQEEINLEIYTPLGTEVNIYDGKNAIKIDSNNKYYQVKYNLYSDVPKELSFLSNENTMISLTLTNKDPFVIIEGTTRIDDDSQIIIKLSQSDTYESISLHLSRIYHGFSYGLFKGNIDFTPKLLESEYDYIKSDDDHVIDLVISNPYLSDPKSITDKDNIYYLLFSIDDPESVSKKATLVYNNKPEYPVINIGESKSILKEGEKYSIGKFDASVDKINIIYQSCQNSLQKINVYNYHNIIFGININNNTKCNFSSFNNNQLDIQVDINLKEDESPIDPNLKGAIIGFTRHKVTEDDIKKYSDLKIKLTQNEDKVEWDSVPQAGSYDVYLLDLNNSYMGNLHNPCLLESFKRNSLQNKKNDATNVKYYSTKDNFISLKDQGKYIVVVAANVAGDIPVICVSDEGLYDSSLAPEEEMDTETIIFVAISLPLVIAFVIILLCLLIRNSGNEEKELEKDDSEQQEENNKIIRDTTISRSSEGNNE